MTRSTRQKGINQFIQGLVALGLPVPEEEYRFHPERKWRVDYCWPDYKLAVEIEGGVWTFGRHNYPSGFEKDREKYNALAFAGYYLLRFVPKEIKSGAIYTALQGWFKEGGS